MSRSRMLVALVLVGSVFVFTACSSSSDDGGEASATSDPDTSSDGQPSDGAESDDPSTDAPAGDAELSTDPIEAAGLSADPETAAAGDGACPFTGAVMDAFAADYEIPPAYFSTDFCRWESDGLVSRIQAGYSSVEDVDVAAQQEGSSSGSIAEVQDGPGTDAVMYFDDFSGSPVPHGYFFVVDDLAVDLSAYTAPNATEDELRALADEMASLVGSAGEIEDWNAGGAVVGENPLCTVWSDAAIATLFAVDEAVHGPGGLGACLWTAGLDSVELSLVEDGESWVTSLVEDHGATALDLGDNAALLIEDDAGQPRVTAALNVGDTTVSIVVSSADYADNAEILAQNLAGRLS